MSPRLQELITSPEGLMIAGMTALMLAIAWLTLAALLNWHDRRERRRIAAEIEAASRSQSATGRYGIIMGDGWVRSDPQDPARWTP